MNKDKDTCSWVFNDYPCFFYRTECCHTAQYTDRVKLKISEKKYRCPFCNKTIVDKKYL